jgi:hypothetical protein
MRISLNHAEGLPSSQLLDREQIHALHGQPRGEGVSEVMEAEIFDLGVCDGRRAVSWPSGRTSRPSITAPPHT